MFQVNKLIFVLWVLFWLYWSVAMVYEVVRGRYKSTVRRQSWAMTVGQNLFFGMALLLTLTNFGQQYYLLGVHLLPNYPVTLYIGFIIAALGIMFAFWARKYLGGNWSGIVALKKNQTLVDTGPYAIVRHPIYFGLTIGIVGSAIAEGTVSGLIAIVCMLIFSLLRIRAEEKLMTSIFGKKYKEYSKRVYKFIPGFW